MSMYLSVRPFLVPVLSAPFLAWLLAVWLPGRTLKWGFKLLLAVLLSFIVLTFSTVIDIASGGGEIHGTPTGIWTLKQYSIGQYLIWAYPFAIPVMLAADALLYFGGRAVRFRRSLAGVILGGVSVGLGILLWIVSAWLQAGLVVYMMET